MTTNKAPARARPRRMLVIVLVALTLWWGAPASAQETPDTTVPQGSTPELLVPGETAPPTTAGSADSVPTVDLPGGGGDSGGGGLDASTKVWLIVIGLIVVAGLTGLLTFLFWRHTRPDRVDVDQAERSWRRAEDPVPDPTLEHPRPQPEPAVEPSPDPEPVAGEAPLEARPPEQPKQPDYWSGV